MELRRLVKSGNSSFTVAIPKEWIDKNKLKKGDIIYIDETSDNSLAVSVKPEEKEELKEMDIIVGNKSPLFVTRELRAAYLSGVNKIHLKLPKDKRDSLVKEIKQAISELAALEIVEENSGSIIVKSFLNYKEIQVTELVRRIDNMARSMLFDSVECIDNPSMAEEIKQRDFEVNRIVFLIFRVLIKCTSDANVAKMNGLQNVDVIKYWHLTFLIEEIADIAKRNAESIKAVMNEKRKLDKKLLKQIYKECVDLYCRAMTILYTKNIQQGVELRDSITAMHKKCDKYLETYQDCKVYSVVGRLKQLLSKNKDLTKLTIYL